MKHLLEIPFKKNNKGNLVIQKPSNALLKSEVSQTVFSKYNLATVNRLFDQTKFILINPDSAHNDQIRQMISKVHQREFIPVFPAHDCTEDNYKTLSFGVYEASNIDGVEKFLFAYLSNETDIMDIEDELERRDLMGNAVLHYLTDLFAVHAGADHSIVYTINIAHAEQHLKAIEMKKKK